MLLLGASCYAYCAAYLISSIINNTIVSDAPKLPYLVTFALLPFSYSIWSISDKSSVIKASLYGSMVSCYSALAIAILQYYWLGMRAEGGAGNAIVFATAACLAGNLCLVGVMLKRGRLQLALLGAVMAGALAILYSGSRIVWVAFPISAAITLFIYRREAMACLSVKTTFIIGLACVAVLAAGHQAIDVRIDAMGSDWTGLVSKGPDDTALGFRVALWQIGLESFWQHPFFGSGINESRLLIARGIHEMLGANVGFTHFHNGLLTVLVEAGLFAALALIAIFALAIRIAYAALKSGPGPIERFGAAMILIVTSTYLICGMTGILVHHDILDSMLMIFLIVGSYLAAGTSLTDPMAPDREQRSFG